MGCDIHMYTEVKPNKYNENEVWVNTDIWEANHDVALDEAEYNDLPSMPTRRYQLSWEHSIYTGRNYSLFGVLAGVRNNVFRPISIPKGINTQLSYQTMGAILEYGQDGHSHSHLTLKELKEYNWHQEYQVFETIAARMKGIIENNPEDYPYDNLAFRQLDDKQYEMSYTITPYGECTEFYENVIPKLEALKDRYKYYDLTDEDIRIVFFFDN